MSNKTKALAKTNHAAAKVVGRMRERLPKFAGGVIVDDLANHSMTRARWAARIAPKLTAEEWSVVRGVLAGTLPECPPFSKPACGALMAYLRFRVTCLPDWQREWVVEGNDFCGLAEPTELGRQVCALARELAKESEA